MLAFNSLEDAVTYLGEYDYRMMMDGKVSPALYAATIFRKVLERRFWQELDRQERTKLMR
jgi:hypothetical protein